MKHCTRLLLIGVLLIITMPLFPQNVFLELNLCSRTSQSFTSSFRTVRNLELIRVIERAGNDKKIGGIILNISSYRADINALWELRNTLEKFKSKGKYICAFISNADLDIYCLATVADKIVMDDLGILTMMGYAWGQGYVQNSLEKLGVGVRELRYFTYKSAAEAFTRSSLSDADRKQYGEILDDIITTTRNTVTKARMWTDDDFNNILDNEFMFSARSALERGLVDRSGRKEAVLGLIKEITGEDNAKFVIYGDHDSSITESISVYGPARASFRSPVIAVVNANGATDMEQGIGAWNLSKTIIELSNNKRVKAIVLRINSPGGSAEAADYVCEAIKTAKTKVPVVVSMGAVAASGGYWASMSASHIVASPVTMTGSIGVIMTWFYDNGLNSKLGLAVDTMQRGKHADLYSGMILPIRDIREEEEARFREYIFDLYADFTSRVAANRGMDIKLVESLAEGRVYSGIGALNAGLIDSIGGLDDAIRIAHELAKIPENKKVAYREYPKPNYFDWIFNNLISIKANNRNATAFLQTPILEDIRYRIAHNGKVMPIMPLNSVWHIY